MGSFKNRDGKSIVMAAIRAVQANKDYLGEVDGLIGDGDHGMNMNKGFTICENRIAGEEMGFSEALSTLGDILLTEIGGSMGPIYGTIFMDMADAAGDVIDEKVFAKMLVSGLEGLKEIIDARVGDKTLVDVLEPAVGAFSKSAEAGKDFAASLNALKESAEAGKESTKDLVAKFGRSSRLGERSRGVLDAGAVSCNIILQAMADEIAALISK
jgi:dihydroxyacetone kinase-like protein